MSTKHTPGPWTEAGRGIFKETQLIAETTHYADADQYAETIANARLIAAAPELLEAAEKLLKRVVKDAETYAPEGNEPIWAFVADMADVIGKAKGSKDKRAELDPATDPWLTDLLKNRK